MVIFDTVEGEAPFEIYKDGSWRSFNYDDDEYDDEDVVLLMDEANEILAQKEEQSLNELPEDIRAILKGHIPDEFLEEILD